MTLTEWLNRNTEYADAIFIDANGKENSFWVKNDKKYDAKILRTEEVNDFCVKLYTDYVED